MTGSETRLAYAANGADHQAIVLNSAAAPRAAVILLPDWRGQGPLARDHAAALNEVGCTVAIADLYGGGFMPDSPDQVGPMVKRLLENRQQGVKALAACVEAVRTTVAPGLPVFILGYSAGGMIALDFGRSGAAVDGIITCSALLKTAEEGQPSRITAPVLILQGTQDQVSPMSVIDQVIAEMDAAGNDFSLNLYGQAHHAFDNPDAGTDPTARLCYSPAAAAAARQAIAAFIDERAR